MFTWRSTTALSTSPGTVGFGDGFGGAVNGSSTFGYGGNGYRRRREPLFLWWLANDWCRYELDRRGSGGLGFIGGSGSGGQAGITAYDGTIALGNWTYVSATGFGGTAY